MFERRGYFAIERAAMEEEAFVELALELGDDLAVEPDNYEIYTSLENFLTVQDERERDGVQVAMKERAMFPQTYMEIPADRVGQVLRLTEALEDHDDVQ